MAKVESIDTIQGANYLAILAALAALERPKLDLALQRMVVVRDKKSPVVLFLDQHESVDLRENLGVRHGAAAKLPAAEVADLSSSLDELETLDHLAGRNLPAIRAAVEVFQAKIKVDLADYKIKVLQTDGHRTIVFVDKDLPPGARSYATTRPAYEVELKASDLSIVRSNFIR